MHEQPSPESPPNRLLAHMSSEELSRMARPAVMRLVGFIGARGEPMDPATDDGAWELREWAATINTEIHGDRGVSAPLKIPGNIAGKALRASGVLPTRQGVGYVVSFSVLNESAGNLPPTRQGCMLIARGDVMVWYPAPGEDAELYLRYALCTNGYATLEGDMCLNLADHPSVPALQEVWNHLHLDAMRPFEPHRRTVLEDYQIGPAQINAVVPFIEALREGKIEG